MQDSSRPATGYPYPYQDPNPHFSIANGNPPPNAGGNAYPYQNNGANNAYPYQNAYYYSPADNSRGKLYSRLFIIFTVLLVILGVSFFIFFLVVRPTVPEVSLDSLSVSGFNLSNNYLSGTWDVHFLARNTNTKMSVDFIELYCAVYYDTDRLTDTHPSPFSLGTNGVTPINASMPLISLYIRNGLVDSISRAREKSGKVVFNVRLVSIITFRYGLYRRTRYFSFLCRDVAVDLPLNSNSGKMIDPVRRCVYF